MARDWLTIESRHLVALTEWPSLCSSPQTKGANRRATLWRHRIRVLVDFDAPPPLSHDGIRWGRVARIALRTLYWYRVATIKWGGQTPQYFIWSNLLGAWADPRFRTGGGAKRSPVPIYWMTKNKRHSIPIPNGSGRSLPPPWIRVCLGVYLLFTLPQCFRHGVFRLWRVHCISKNVVVAFFTPNPPSRHRLTFSHIRLYYGDGGSKFEIKENRYNILNTISGH